MYAEARKTNKRNNQGIINSMESMFWGDTLLTTIHLPDLSENMLNLSNLNHAFRECRNLESITIGGNTLPKTITGMNSTYWKDYKLKNVIPIPVTSMIPTYAFISLLCMISPNLPRTKK